MTGKMIKKTSNQLNKNNYLKSIYILIFGLVVLVIFSVSPVFISRITENSMFFKAVDSDIKSALNIALLVICTFVSYLFYSSFSIGEAAWYSGRYAGKKNCLKRLVFWFLPRHSLKALCLCTLVFLIKMCWTFTLCLPGLLTLFSAVTLAFTGGIELYLFLSLAIGSALLLITGLIFAFIISQRYFLAKYLIVDNPKLGVIQVIKQSENLTEGQLSYIVRFKCRFAPTIILYPFILPIIYLYPHYKQSRSIIAKELYI